MIPSVALASSVLSSLRARRSLLPVVLALCGGAQQAWAQVHFTGTAASENFGSQATGSPSAAQTLNFSISAGTTVGSIAVMTQGSPNLDFASAAGTTCAATTYVSAATCVVNVTFTPKYAGLRMGAVVFFSASGDTGTQLGSVPIYGIGTGPQIFFGHGTAIAIDPTVNGVGLFTPVAVALDGAGDLFIADDLNGRVVEVPIGGGSAIAIDPAVNGEGLSNDSPSGVAVDGAGDLFISDAVNERVVEVPSGGGAATAIAPTADGEGLFDPGYIVVDGAGDLFISDFGHARLVEVPAGGGTPIAIVLTVNGLILFSPLGLAVDGAGDLFIADVLNNRVVEVPAGGGAPIAIDPTANGRSLYQPRGVAVDAAGDLFIADYGNNRVVEAPAGGGAATAIDPEVSGEGFNGLLGGLAVDAAGDLFIGDAYNHRVVEVERSQPPAVNFPTQTVVGSTDTTDGAQTVQVQNIGNLALDFTGLSYPADFSAAGGDSNACTSSTSLGAGQECDLPIQFTPENLGSLSEDVTLTDDTLGVGGTQQKVVVSGTAITGVPAALTAPTAGSTLGASATFTWNAGVGVSVYELVLGTIAPGTDNLGYFGGPKVLSYTASLPTDGVTVFARLYSLISGEWKWHDYTFTEGGTLVKAVMLPASGSVLPGSSQTFSWAGGKGPAAYWLYLGTTGAGSANLYSSGSTTATSVTVNGLPTNGVKVYAKFLQLIDGAWQSTYYTYTAQ